MRSAATTFELQELVRFASGGTPSKSEPSNWGGDIPWLSAKDLKRFNLHDSQDHLTVQGAKGVTLAPAGSILVLVRGMTLLKDLPLGVAMRPMTFNQDVKALLPFAEARPHYLAYVLVSRKQELLQLVETAVHGTGRLDTEILKSFPVDLPSLHQQDRFIETLGTWDAAIDKTTALLDALERRKQGLMQQLLTGRRRLKGFTGKWTPARLGAVLERVTRKNTTGCMTPLTVSAQRGLVEQSSYFAKQIAATDNDHYLLLQRGEFAYNRSASIGYPLGAIKRLDSFDEGIVSTLCLCFGIAHEEKTDSDFLVGLIEAGLLNRELRAIAQEGARSHGLLNVTATDFFNIRVSLPNIDEQRAIAEVLGDMDTELVLRRGQLEQLKTQKRALMQKLLSGEWYLPDTPTQGKFISQKAL